MLNKRSALPNYVYIDHDRTLADSATAWEIRHEAHRLRAAGNQVKTGQRSIQIDGIWHQWNGYKSKNPPKSPGKPPATETENTGKSLVTLPQTWLLDLHRNGSSSSRPKLAGDTPSTGSSRISHNKKTKAVSSKKRGNAQDVTATTFWHARGLPESQVLLSLKEGL